VGISRRIRTTVDFLVHFAAMDWYFVRRRDAKPRLFTADLD
jgi:hypothetical protein